MSAGDILITIVIWLYKGATSLLPTEISGLPYATFTGYLDSVKEVLVSAFSGLSHIVDVRIVLMFAGVIILGETILFGVRGVIFLINLIRGSGA